MALSLYKYENSGYVAISSDSSNTIKTVHDGKRGNTRILQLFLRNDSSSNWYSNIKITPEDTEEPNSYGDISFYETGWGIKLSTEELEPTASEWEDIEWGEYTWMEDVGSDSAADTNTYFPFWYLISSPPNINAENKTDIQLRVSFTENTVI